MPAPTTVDLLWGTAARPKRGPKPALTLDGIVGTAIEIADTEGLSGLSMQRLAERLGFTKMSLYRYVPGREQLTALMVDAAVGAPPADTATGDWRERLRRWAHAIHERYRAHPWAIELTLGVRPIGPNELSWTEAALAALDGTPLRGGERLDAIVLLNGHVRSLAQQLVGQDQARMGEDFAAQVGASLAAAGDRYPQVLAAFAEDAAGSGGALDFGIDRILDGLGVLIDARR
ncbi:TetR/AcrR family transcriptional regulator [Nocardia thailandica]|uniref:TetR/AcrR family transcriptional regulator n=1 Tax=Nocardia thailandica TaxID=257275 RepID=UPI00031ACFEC|nr:TetR/AcrR family transcriptional regulator [Nocardia thailandica]